MYDLVAHLGLTYSKAYQIAEAINAGMSLASVMSIATGAGGLISMFWFAIKKVAYTKSKAVVVGW